MKTLRLCVSQFLVKLDMLNYFDVTLGKVGSPLQFRVDYHMVCTLI